MRINLTQGAYRYRPEGEKSAVVAKAGDPGFDLPSDEAARLVALGVAEYTSGEVATAQIQAQGESAGEPLPEEEGAGTAGKEPPAYDAGMKAAQLRDLMGENGIPFKVGMTKADMVKALDAFFGEEMTEDGDGLVLEAEPPVI
jgi:hypothetical protein